MFDLEAEIARVRRADREREEAAARETAENACRELNAASSRLFAELREVIGIPMLEALAPTVVKESGPEDEDASFVIVIDRPADHGKLILAYPKTGRGPAGEERYSWHLEASPAFGAPRRGLWPDPERLAEEILRQLGYLRDEYERTQILQRTAAGDWL